MSQMPMWVRGALGLLAALLVLPALARASTSIVPDDHPTIQGALDAPDRADSILVRPGVYDEDLVARGWVNVIAIGNTDLKPAAVRVRSLHVRNDETPFQDYERLPRFRGLHITGAATAACDEGVTGYGARFQHCRLDIGLATGCGAWSILQVEGCEARGPLSIDAAFVRIDGCHMIGAGIDMMWYDGAGISNCLIEDAPGFAIRGRNRDPGLGVAGNHIVRCGEGIVLPGYGSAAGNVIEDCVGVGIRVGSATSQFTGHVSVGDNRILRCGSDGVLLEQRSIATIHGNVIGRCGGDGVRITLGHNSAILERNTLYANAGAGARVPESCGLLAGWNISAFNHVGLEWPGGRSGSLEFCNTWYGNPGGDLVGVDPGATDLSVDPLFCDIDADSVALRSDSPLLRTSCGLVGALGEGCTDATETLDPGRSPIQPQSTGLFLAPAVPNPAGAATRIAYALPRDMPIRLAVYDTQGRCVETLVDGIQSAGTHEAVFRGPGRAGVFFVRLDAGGETLSRPVQFVR